MNKTVKTILIAGVVVVLVVAIIYAILVVNKEQETDIENIPDVNDLVVDDEIHEEQGTLQPGLEQIASQDDLVALVEKIYEGQGELYSSLMTQELDVADSDSVSYYTGLKNGDFIECIVVSEPMMMSQAYSLVLAKVKDGVNANEVAKKMAENIDTRKWICVSAEKLYATSSGDVVFLIMTNEEMATPIYEKFKSLAGNVNEVYEKTEEPAELPEDMY